MNKVYVLIEYFIEDTNIMGIFGNKEVALKAQKHIEQIKDSRYYSYNIEEWEMDCLCLHYYL